jgi:hypothetical protein
MRTNERVLTNEGDRTNDRTRLKRRKQTNATIEENVELRLVHTCPGCDCRLRSMHHCLSLVASPLTARLRPTLRLPRSGTTSRSHSARYLPYIRLIRHSCRSTLITLPVTTTAERCRLTQTPEHTQTKDAEPTQPRTLNETNTHKQACERTNADARANQTNAISRARLNDDR